MMVRYLSLFSLWLGPILSFYTAFLRQSFYFFSFAWAMEGHFSALLLLSVLHHCLQFGFDLKHFWPGKSRHCPGCGTASSMIDSSQTLPLALIACGNPEQGILANQIRANGVSHRRCILTQLTCTLFYCQIIMTILANIPKKNSYRLQLFFFFFLTTEIEYKVQTFTGSCHIQSQKSFNGDETTFSSSCYDSDMKSILV